MCSTYAALRHGCDDEAHCRRHRRDVSGCQRAELAELGDGRGLQDPARGIFSPEIAAILMQIELRVDPSRRIFMW